MDQATRFAHLNAFKGGELQLLGVFGSWRRAAIDIGGLSHVFNFDVPFRDEDYVHRIGRTGRAGREAVPTPSPPPTTPGTSRRSRS